MKKTALKAVFLLHLLAENFYLRVFENIFN